MAEQWHSKPKALGSIPGRSIFLSDPYNQPFQRSIDSDSLIKVVNWT